MLRFLPGQPRAGPRPGGRGQLDGSPLVTAVRIGVVGLALIVAPFTGRYPAVGIAGMAWMASLAVTAAAFLVWLLLTLRGDALSGGALSGPRWELAFTAALAVLGLSGGILAGLSTLNLTVAVGCVATATAGTRLRPETSLAITAGTVATFLLAGLATGAPAVTLLGYSFAFAGLWAFGMTRRAFLLRAEQAERMLEQARRAREAETQAAALAERARIAREIHDVLAHSLAAVSVNLEAAEGLLGSLPDSPELAKALECVERAGTFTRNGLAEARRAVTTLRETVPSGEGHPGQGDDGEPEAPVAVISAAADRATAPAPASLAGQLARLVAEFRAAGDAPMEFGASGEQRPVTAEASLAVFRTAQEALTNARKHAPGQPVTIALEFTPDSVKLRAVNPLTPGSGTSGSGTPGSGTPGEAGVASEPAAPARLPLAPASGGHGLVGLRERAELAGGTLTAGPDGPQPDSRRPDGPQPDGRQWRVCLRIPA
ncbi:MAG: hypothetical protein J2P25_10745 [Nocardiopsaceae bacterium]|nr:hypothetical protein [Nocardiopsaceae bacterium]